MNNHDGSFSAGTIHTLFVPLIIHRYYQETLQERLETTERRKQDNNTKTGLK